MVLYRRFIHNPGGWFQTCGIFDHRVSLQGVLKCVFHILSYDKSEEGGVNYSSFESSGIFLRVYMLII